MEDHIAVFAVIIGIILLGIADSLRGKYNKTTFQVYCNFALQTIIVIVTLAVILGSIPSFKRHRLLTKPDQPSIR